ncbi:hypothetical protein [Geobacter sp. SVR]|uniref:hypothetical protein n=1 Tax=Geobacter sp. SVR TaxID=2495594 RepID=UPI0015678AB2|nr:hypothetical protein [Geobacter sp. SVR]
MNLIRSNEDNYENRINIISDAEYKRLIYKGDYNLDFNDDREMARTQQKTLVGVKLVDELSFRYQYENYDAFKYTNVPASLKNGKLIPASVKIKETQWKDNRYGLGYKYSFGLFDNTAYKTKVILDAMVLKEERNDFRTEYSVTFDNKYFRIRNQTYFDYNSLNMQKYYNRVIVNYKITQNFSLNAQTIWQTDKTVAHRLGISVSF